MEKSRIRFSLLLFLVPIINILYTIHFSIKNKISIYRYSLVYNLVLMMNMVLFALYNYISLTFGLVFGEIIIWLLVFATLIIISDYSDKITGSDKKTFNVLSNIMTFSPIISVIIIILIRICNFDNTDILNYAVDIFIYLPSVTMLIATIVYGLKMKRALNNGEY